jgi:hypothetical protein
MRAVMSRKRLDKSSLQIEILAYLRRNSASTPQAYGVKHLSSWQNKIIPDDLLEKFVFANFLVNT